MKRTRKTEIPQAVIELGNRIKDIIKEKNLMPKNVAYDAGLDVENLRKYTKGIQEMEITTMLKIASALDVEPSELIKGLNIDFEK